MAAAQHTPGPWVNHGCYIYRTGTDGKRTGPAIANTRVDEFIAPEEEEANAHLIAASPKLLSELRNTSFLLMSACLVIEDAEAREVALAAVKRAGAAIAKATGRPQ